MEAAAGENVVEAACTYIGCQGSDVADQTKSGKQVGFRDADLRRCAAAWSSARLTSGLRRSKSGNSDDHLLGAVGISDGPASKSSSGGVAYRVTR